jgi:hypothetical protein
MKTCHSTLIFLACAGVVLGLSTQADARALSGQELLLAAGMRGGEEGEPSQPGEEKFRWQRRMLARHRRTRGIWQVQRTVCDGRYEALRIQGVRSGCHALVV